jgi:hypothetical protein
MLALKKNYSEVSWLCHLLYKGPLWVKSRRLATSLRMSAFRGKADMNQLAQSIPHLQWRGGREGMRAGTAFKHHFLRILGTRLERKRSASGMPEPKSGRKYIKKSLVTLWPEGAMNSSGMTLVLPATASRGWRGYSTE